VLKDINLNKLTSDSDVIAIEHNSIVQYRCFNRGEKCTEQASSNVKNKGKQIKTMKGTIRVQLSLWIGCNAWLQFSAWQKHGEKKKEELTRLFIFIQNGQGIVALRKISVNYQPKYPSRPRQEKAEIMIIKEYITPIPWNISNKSVYRFHFKSFLDSFSYTPTSIWQ
jgi:hypothetical protein